MTQDSYELITNFITAMKSNLERDIQWCASEIEFNNKLIESSKRVNYRAGFEQGVNVGLRHELRYDKSLVYLVNGLAECLERIQNELE